MYTDQDGTPNELGGRAAGATRHAERIRTIVSWAVLVATFVYLMDRLAALVVTVEDYQFFADLPSDLTGVDVHQARRLADLEHLMVLVFWPLNLIYIAGNLGWTIAARRVAARRGRTLRHGSLTVRNVVLVVLVVLPFGQQPVRSGDTVDALRSYGVRVDTRSLATIGAQVVLAGLLFAVVWLVRRQVQEMLTQPSSPKLDETVKRAPLAAYRLWRQRRNERVYE